MRLFASLALAVYALLSSGIGSDASAQPAATAAVHMTGSDHDLATHLAIRSEYVGRWYRAVRRREWAGAAAAAMAEVRSRRAVTHTPRSSAGPTPSSTSSAAGHSVWDRLAGCEATGDWSANTGNGFYGGLQFTLGTWRANGGTGMPNEASREQQIAVAESVLATQGWVAWPACSRKLGYR